MMTQGLLREHSSALAAVIRVLDILLILVSGIAVYIWYLDEWPMPPHYQIAIYLAAILALLVFPVFGIYQSWRGGGLTVELRRLALAWGSVILILIVMGSLTKTSINFSRVWLGVWFLSAWILLIVFHSLLRIFLRWIREQGFNVRRIVLVGAGDLGRQVARQIQNAPWTGIKIMAFYDDNPELHGKVIEGIKVKGNTARLARVLQRYTLDEVWLAMPLGAEKRIKDILYNLRHSPVSVRFVPDIFGFRLLNHSVSEVAGVPVLDLTATPMTGMNKVIKALEDRILAAIILILVSPLLLVIAIGVKLSSPGPVFYRQKRVSWNGRPFTMLKFRSMPVDAEQKTGAVWARKDEDRATPFGRFLRRTSLDELPQFFNVLMGQMSVVGPRPERPVLVDKFKDEIPDYMMKHMVKAGITGWAQVNGWRGDTDLNKRIEYDMYYIENWSLWFDLKIIFLTLFKGFVHKNAY